ncbi:MAG: heme ABC exporter ATP-binding protein CcmA [Xanthobacteraceae bacterium]
MTCVRGGRVVFAGLSFRVAAGQALILLGRNGAGKSSLLRLVAGLLRPAAGTITLGENDAELSVAEQAHYLGHLDALKPSLTVRENLTFWADFLGGSQPAVTGTGVDAVTDALAAVGLGDLADLPAGYLSAGQRRRLSLARLLAVPRPLWLLDEPTAALDVAAQARLAELMQEHLTAGGLILVATHSPLGLAGARELRLGETG